MTHKTVVYKYSTGNPVQPNGSGDVRDGIDNLMSFDILMNDESDTYNQRDGEVVQTVAGAIRSIGFKPGSGDFATGFTVMPGQRDYAWYDPVSHNWYSYLGAIPTGGHIVAPGTNPAGDSNWRPSTDELLRGDLSHSDGLKSIGACADMTALKAVTGTTHGQQIYLRSYAAGKNLGGGIFQWDASSTKPNDDGCIIAVTGVSTGRWLRQYDFTKTPEMFGAIGDGVTDDTTALQRMFTSANNSGVLAENFFGAFKLRHKYLVSATLNCGRPIKVDAYGAELLINTNIPCVNFSMHNGEWAGGYFNYTGVANSSITEVAVAMTLAPENSPIMVMASTIKHVRIWGAHTGIKFTNPNTAIWQVHLDNIHSHVRAGSSAQKAVGYNLSPVGGPGGSTTIRLTECHVGGYGATPGAGLKGFVLNGINEVMMTNCAYDWYDVAAGVDRPVAARDIIDATVFSLTIDGFHTEQLINTTATFAESPIYINTNSCSLDGFEMLLTDHINNAAWVWLAGNGVANIGRWHDLPKSGKTKGAVLNLALVDKAIQIFSSGSVRSTDILGGSSRINLSVAGEEIPYHTDFDIQIASGQAFFNLPQDCAAINLSVVGANIADGNAGFAADLLLVRDGSGNWNIDSRAVKMPTFVGATISFSVVGQQVVFTVNNAFTYRMQTRVEYKRAQLASW